MRRLLLVRHGNTFEDGTVPTRVGARSDLPLTQKGLQQAQTFAAAVRAAGLRLGPFFAGPLQRTRDFVANGFGVAPTLDTRLREIDYGDWEGLTDAEIAARVGTELLEDWNRRCVWPHGQNWAPDEATLAAGAASLVHELASGAPRFVPVLCSSQGVLRYFAKLDAAFFANAQRDAKLGVATGACCGVRVAPTGALAVDFWNDKPDAERLAAWMRI
ncbi:MAG: histidine phosphatase family protein [Telmatospirillum sp.]|nr:histidine phosphatase family protein [Telmatospirillum sp.]